MLGGISGKGLTLNGQPGNDGERLLETPSGLMNSIGLQNPGVQHFIENELPAMKTCGTSVWVNLGGHTIEENVEGVQKLCAAGIDVLELNISCPNVKQGGLAFGIRAKDAEEVVSAVRKVCTVPLVVKLSPQAESIPDMCKAVEAAGADGISLCNTFQACAIDLEKRRPVFNNTFAGLSGPAIRPIALRMVWQAVGAVNIPGIGLGVIASGASRITDEMLMSASETLAQYSPLVLNGEGLVLPELKDIQKVSRAIAFAVGKMAQQQGVAVKTSAEALQQAIDDNFWHAEYRDYRRTSI